MDYGVVFSGKIHESSNREQVRDNFARLFRLTDPARLQRLFSGEEVTLKKGLSAEEAEKYRLALLKAGALCEVRKLGAAAPVPAPKPPATAPQKSAPVAPSFPAGLSLVPTDEEKEAAAATPSAALVPLAEARPSDAGPARFAARDLTPAPAGNTGPASRSNTSASPARPAAQPAAFTPNISNSTPDPKDRSMVIKGSGSGYGDLSIMPAEAQGLCWGGFFLPWIWGPFNGMTFSLAMLPGFRIFRRFLPIWLMGTLTLLLSFFMLFKGREIAWNNKTWDSAEHFNQVQRRWTLAGAAVTLVLVVVIPMWVVNTAHKQKMQEQAEALMMQQAQQSQQQERQAYLDSIQDPAEREQARKEFEAEDAADKAAGSESTSEE